MAFSGRENDDWISLFCIQYPDSFIVSGRLQLLPPLQMLSLEHDKPDRDDVPVLDHPVFKVPAGNNMEFPARVPCS